MELDFLRPLYDEPGDSSGERGAKYVSVYLDTTPTPEDASAQLALRWRAAHEQLAAAGADDATLDAVREAVTTLRHDARGRAAFAVAGEVRLSVPLPAPPPREIARCAPLPHVMPLLAQFPPHLPHVRVGASHAGGQVVAVAAAGTPEWKEAIARSWPIHKVSVGGWAERRVQLSTEEAWAENARLTAETAVAEAKRIGARFVIVGGDVRERSMVLDLLPRPLRDTAVLVDKEVAPDAAAFDDAANAESARRAAADGQARLDEFRVRMNDKDLTARRAVEGVGGTLAALRDGLVADVLLSPAAVDPGASDPATPDPQPLPDAWIGPGPADVAATAEELRERGVTGAVPERGDAALVRAAAGTGAALFFLPPDADRPLDGIGALLRAPLAAV